jgi:hypothetical protein
LTGKLDLGKHSKPYLLCSKTLEKVNSQTIAYFINKGLNILYPTAVHDTKILLLCTAAASYMLAAPPLLKVFYPHLIHVTCLAHSLKRLVKQIMNEFPEMNSPYFEHDESILQTPFRIVAFKEKLPTPRCHHSLS